MIIILIFNTIILAINRYIKKIVKVHRVHDNLPKGHHEIQHVIVVCQKVTS